jgi:hypothetical protein
VCERDDARAAQNAAADVLTAVCAGLCADPISAALHALYDATLVEAVPDDLRAIVQRLQEYPSERR